MAHDLKRLATLAQSTTPLPSLQAYLHVLVDRPGSQLQLPVEMMQRARTVWLASARKVRISQLHRDVSRVLAELGVTHAKEQLTEDQLFSVDIALTGGHTSGYLSNVAAIGLLAQDGTPGWQLGRHTGSALALLLHCCRVRS